MFCGLTMLLYLCSAHRRIAHHFIKQLKTIWTKLKKISKNSWIWVIHPMKLQTCLGCWIKKTTKFAPAPLANQATYLLWKGMKTFQMFSVTPVTKNGKNSISRLDATFHKNKPPPHENIFFVGDCFFVSEIYCTFATSIHHQTNKQ